jgi:L-alanine-DL-glutamate epimerase-like enolase superfamily enzyme
MHLNAAVGGPGFVEVDANPNPLRDFLALPMPHLLNGDVILSDEPGLGVEPDLLSLKKFLITTSK